jgi:hypothetical protein
MRNAMEDHELHFIINIVKGSFISYLLVYVIIFQGNMMFLLFIGTLYKGFTLRVVSFQLSTKVVSTIMFSD